MAAESWEEFLPPLKKLNDAVKSFPSPPAPDDGYAGKMNDLNRAVEGIDQTVRSKIEQEQ